MNEKNSNMGGESPENNAADDLPAGDSPPPPAWQLPVAIVAWASWIIFLLVMLGYRTTLAP